MKGTAEERIRELERYYPVWEEHTVWTRFVKNSEQFRNNTFLIYQDDVVLTYGIVREHVDDTAKALFVLGIRPGDHVAVQLYNCPEFVYLIFALAKLGAVLVAVNMKLPDKDRAYILCQSESIAVIGTKLPSEEIKRGLPHLKYAVDIQNWNSFLSNGKNADELEIDHIARKYFDPNAVTMIMYTSGSTSFPKGVQITHNMILRSSFGTVRTRLFEIGRRMFVPVPLYHIYCYMEALIPLLYVGGTMIFANIRFRTDNVLYLMKKYHANDFICVPIVIANLILEGDINKEDFPDLHAAYWASTCPEWIWDAARKTFGINDVTTGYGMTECSSTTSMMSPMDQKDLVKRYVGRLKTAGIAGLPEYDGKLMKLKICDHETGKELKPGRTGEIWCKGPVVTPGYYKNDDANHIAFTDDGWFKTGDMGCQYSDGLLVFEGRINEMYKTNGENVSPERLNQIISKQSEVQFVEVVGIPYGKYGEVGVAFVDCGVTNHFKETQIKEYCKDNLAPFEVPKFFVFGRHTDWPLTAAGKIQKEQLKRKARELFPDAEN